MDWKCYACGLNFPIGGYGDSTTEPMGNDLQKLCITQGHWRRCLACARLKGGGSGRMQVCARCQCKRDLAAFGDDSICSSCKLREPFEACLCGICGKIKSMKDMRETVPGSGNFLCSACAPNLQLFKCTACHEVNPATNFRDFRQGMSALEKDDPSVQDV